MKMELGIRSSKRRSTVISAFVSAGRHITVDELFERAKKIDPKVGYTTVWRTLKLLESKGLASPQKFHDGHTRYEYIKKEVHHDHIICIECGRVEEFCNPRIEEIQKHVASAHKFKITSHKMELYGYCAKCSG